MRARKKRNTTRGPQYRIVVEDTLTDSQLKSMNKQYREKVCEAKTLHFHQVTSTDDVA
jgi:hypothetical protein